MIIIIREILYATPQSKGDLTYISSKEWDI
jgi:hypothetical protein